MAVTTSTDVGTVLGKGGGFQGGVAGVSRARVSDEVGLLTDSRAVRPSAAHSQHKLVSLRRLLCCPVGR